MSMSTAIIYVLLVTASVRIIQYHYYYSVPDYWSWDILKNRIFLSCLQYEATSEMAKYII